MLVELDDVINWLCENADNYTEYVETMDDAYACPAPTKEIIADLIKYFKALEEEK